MPDICDAAFSGRPSTLFTIIAGISIALITGRDRPVAGAWFVRAVNIFAIGCALTMLVHNGAVILENDAVLFVLVPPFLTWPSRRVFQLASALTLMLPPLYQVLLNLALREQHWRISGLTVLLSTGSYPAIT